jgi:hypothetical protein
MHNAIRIELKRSGRQDGTTARASVDGNGPPGDRAGRSGACVFGYASSSTSERVDSPVNTSRYFP